MRPSVEQTPPARRAGIGRVAVLALLFAVMGPGAARAQGDDALTQAARAGDVAAVRRLVAGGVPVDTRFYGGHTALMSAAAYGEVEVVRYLLAQGADPTLRDDEGRTALDRARDNGESAAVAVLQAARGGAAPVARDGGTGGTPRPGTPQAAPRPGGQVPWPAMGRFRPGDEVLYRTAGNLWSRGVVEQVGPDPDAVVGTTDGMYRIRGEGWYHHHAVAGVRREPFWTGFFVGDWEVSVPAAMTTQVRGRDVYRVVSGGMRLPPLRIDADGTYTWRVLTGGGEKVVRGRWVAREDAPGVVLLDADQGADWRAYNASDRSSLATFGRAQVHLTSDCCTYQTAQRIPTERLVSARPGDRVMFQRGNGSWDLVEVVEVGGGRFKVRDRWGARPDEWVTADRLRSPEQ